MSTFLPLPQAPFWGRSFCTFQKTKEKKVTLLLPQWAELCSYTHNHSILTHARVYIARKKVLQVLLAVLTAWFYGAYGCKLASQKCYRKCYRCYRWDPDLSKPQKGGEIFQKLNEFFQNGGAVFQKVDAVFWKVGTAWKIPDETYRKVVPDFSICLISAQKHLNVQVAILPYQ